MHAARGLHRIEISSLANTEIQPQIQLKTAAVVLKANESKITPLSGTRDVIPEGRQIYQNLFSFTLNVAKPMEIAVYAPLFNPVLYESEFESQLWMIFDSNKAMIACGDANSHTFYTKLEKGEYTIRMQIRHEKREALEKISETNMIALCRLATPLNLDFYAEYNQCIVSGQKFTASLINRNVPKVLYLGPLTQEKLTKANLPNNCCWLTGTITLPKDDLGKRIDVQQFYYFLNPSEGGGKKNGSNGSTNTANSGGGGLAGKTKASNVNTPPAGANAPANASASGGDSASAPAVADSNKKLSIDEYSEGLRDFQCSMLTKLDYDKAEKIHDEIVAAHPKHLSAHLLLIQNIESTELKAQYPFTFAKSLKDNNNKSSNTFDSTNDGTATSTGTDAACGTSSSLTIDDNKQKDDNQKLRNAATTVVRLADHVIKGSDIDVLLAFYGLKHDTRPDAAKIKS
uniref:Tripeptidyl peptidase II Ig-like domain-containing protein n=1 Tax=Glossina brevipalpis TaxID=37001 RepID=A0A1A9X3J2_9MUSC